MAPSEASPSLVLVAHKCSHSRKGVGWQWVIQAQATRILALWNSVMLTHLGEEIRAFHRFREQLRQGKVSCRLGDLEPINQARQPPVHQGAG